MYRLVLAVHYDRERVFILRFLTHAEYSKGHWKLARRFGVDVSLFFAPPV